jgi:hypothetical protein
MTNSLKKNFAHTLIAIPILIWWAVILKNVVNIPWFDDFDPFVDFLRKWINTESIVDRIVLIFQPNNEHRMIFGKIPTILYYYLTGTVNFTYLQIVGNCFGLGICWIFWKAFLKSNLSIWYFVPIPFLLFQFQDYLIFLWSICNLQHHPVLFFVLAAMFCLSEGRMKWALVFAFCATFSMGNGMFVWFSGGAMLLFQQKYKQLVLWSMVGVLHIFVYLFGIKPQGNEDSIAFLLHNPWASLEGFATFLGGLMDLFPWWSIEYRIKVPMFLGALLVVALGILNYYIWIYPVINAHREGKHHSKWIIKDKLKVNGENPFVSFLLGVLVFILLNGIIIGLLRMRFGFLVMLVSNYKLYPAIFMIVSYFLFLATIKVSGEKVVFCAFLTLALLIWVLSAYSFIPNILERRNTMIANAHNQNFNAMGLGHVPFSNSAHYVDHLLKEVISKDIYKYPPEVHQLLERIDPYVNQEGNDFDAQITHSQDKIRWIEKEHAWSMGPQDGVYIYLKSTNNFYIFRAVQNPYTGKNFMKQYAKGAGLEISTDILEPGIYQNGMVRVQGDRISHHKLKVLEVEK